MLYLSPRPALPPHGLATGAAASSDRIGPFSSRTRRPRWLADSSSSQNCTSVRTSSFRTSRAGDIPACRSSLRLRHSRRSRPIGCARRCRPRRQSSIAPRSSSCYARERVPYVWLVDPRRDRRSKCVLTLRGSSFVTRRPIARANSSRGAVRGHRDRAGVPLGRAARALQVDRRLVRPPLRQFPAPEAPHPRPVTAPAQFAPLLRLVHMAVIPA